MAVPDEEALETQARTIIRRLRTAAAKGRGARVSAAEIATLAATVLNIGDKPAEFPKPKPKASRGKIIDQATPEAEEVYQRIVALVRRTGRVSTQDIQQELGIGFNSAARAIERMETEHIVAKPDASGRRSVIS